MLSELQEADAHKSLGNQWRMDERWPWGVYEKICPCTQSDKFTIQEAGFIMLPWLVWSLKAQAPSWKPNLLQ